MIDDGSRARRFLLERLESSEAARPDWSRLAASSGNVFATWEWMSAWSTHLGERGTHVLYGWRDTSGPLAAVVPLVVSRRGPLRVVRFAGHGPADELGPVCAPEDRAPALAEAVRHALGDGGGLFLAEQLPRDRDWSSVLDGRVVRREASPVIRSREGGWASYLASKSANFREQVRARERRLRRRYEVAFRRTDDPDRLQDDMGTLLALHRARWGTRESAFRSEAFHRAFAEAALDRGWLRLWFLELDGRPAAAWYGFRFGDVESFYQSGRDPRLERDSVGFVLLAHTIREALDDGVREYRLLRGDEPYKYRFADADPGVVTVAVGRGMLGNATALAGAARHRFARMRSGSRARELSEAGA